MSEREREPPPLEGEGTTNRHTEVREACYRVRAGFTNRSDVMLLADIGNEWADSSRRIRELEVAHIGAMHENHRLEGLVLAADEARRRLAAQLAEARGLLADVEWGPEPELPTSACPWCLRMKRDGHEAGCELGRYLAGRATATAGSTADTGSGFVMGSIEIDHENKRVIYRNAKGERIGEDADD